MRTMRNRWLVWSSKVLSVLIAMLGVSSCHVFHPCMYGSPNPNQAPVDTVKKRPSGEIKLMYGVPNVRYEKQGLGDYDIQIEKK